MKKINTVFIGLLCLMGFELNSTAQSLVVNGTVFLPQDSIGFTYDSPNYDPLDWIGIYHVGDTPGGPASVFWDTIPEASGTLYLPAPDEGGLYIAYLLCCYGYDIIATSLEFQVAVPSITASASVYTQGDSMVFTYVSPRFSDSDWIGIYSHGEKPDGDPESLDWDYIPDSAGTLAFHTVLDPGLYDAYLLCCNGYDSISACTFEVKGSNTPYVAATKTVFASGAPIDIKFNDPSYASDDWIGIYFEGDDPVMVTSVAWENVSAQAGIVSFPGTLPGGNYFAVLFCCNGTETEYARSSVFTVQAGTSGTYVKTVASVYPEGAHILINFRNPDLQEKDWIGIYHKGESPGGTSSIDYQYITSDSGTVEFTTALTAGEYVVFMLCCDGYNIKAKYNFKVADASTPSLVTSSMTYAANDSIVFYYNSPNYDPLDWIGIYNPGDIPGEINSITWLYLPTDVASGSLVFHYPNDVELEPGEYWAGLFCCDVYDLYAQTTIIITEATGIDRITRSGKVNIYPNPSEGMISVRTDGSVGINGLKVYSLTGQLIYSERIPVMTSERTFNLEFLGRGMYIIRIDTTENSPVSVKLVIQ